MLDLDSVVDEALSRAVNDVGGCLGTAEDTGCAGFFEALGLEASTGEAAAPMNFVSAAAGP